MNHDSSAWAIGAQYNPLIMINTRSLRRPAPALAYWCTAAGRRSAPWSALFALVCLQLVGCAAFTPDLGLLGDSQYWRLINGGVATRTENGQVVAELAPIGGNLQGSNIALAQVHGLQFATGTIDIDLRGNGAAAGSFLGIAFGVADATTHEAVYFRPFNFRSANPEHRAHAVQYVALPDYPWNRLRAEHPGVYERPLAPPPDPAGWFHVRIKVGVRRVEVFVDAARRPCLVVDRLGRAAVGSVALWVDSQPGSFAGLKIARNQ